MDDLSQARLAERAELQQLNDRLAAYIDRVRHLEAENARLAAEVRESHDAVHRATTNVKQLYGHELSALRTLLDETAREKSKLEIDTKRQAELNDKLRQRCDRIAHELSVVSQSARFHEALAAETNGKLTAALGASQKAAAEARQAQEDLEGVSKQLDDLRGHLEDETLARVHLENVVQTLRDELTFNGQMHEQQLTEARLERRRLGEVGERDGAARLAEAALNEATLALALRELRAQYERQQRENRAEIEAMFEQRLLTLRNEGHLALQKLRESRSNVETLMRRIGELEVQSGELNEWIAEQERLLEAGRQRHLDDETEMGRLREEMAQRVREYQDLMDIKVSLDLEIAAYGKLLGGEEHRLNTQPGSTDAEDSEGENENEGEKGC